MGEPAAQELALTGVAQTPSELFAARARVSERRSHHGGCGLGHGLMEGLASTCALRAWS